MSSERGVEGFDVISINVFVFHNMTSLWMFWNWGLILAAITVLSAFSTFIFESNPYPLAD